MVLVREADLHGLVLEAMNKRELAERLAKQSHRSRAEAADEVDKLIHQILKDLQKPAETSTNEKSTALPKLPSITPIRPK